MSELHYLHIQPRINFKLVTPYLMDIRSSSSSSMRLFPLLVQYATNPAEIKGYNQIGMEVIYTSPVRYQKPKSISSHYSR